MSLLDVKCSRRETAAFFIVTDSVFKKHALTYNLIGFVKKSSITIVLMYILRYICAALINVSS